jgi:hypothetical protein
MNKEPKEVPFVPTIPEGTIYTIDDYDNSRVTLEQKLHNLKYFEGYTNSIEEAYKYSAMQIGAIVSSIERYNSEPITRNELGHVIGGGLKSTITKHAPWLNYSRAIKCKRVYDDWRAVDFSNEVQFKLDYNAYDVYQSSPDPVKEKVNDKLAKGEKVSQSSIKKMREEHKAEIDKLKLDTERMLREKENSERALTELQLKEMGAKQKRQMEDYQKQLLEETDPNKLDKLTIRIAELSASNKNLQDELRHAKQTNSTLKTNISVKESELKASSNANKEATTKLFELQDKVAKLEAALVSASSNPKTSKEDTQKLKSALVRAQNDIEVLKSKSNQSVSPEVAEIYEIDLAIKLHSEIIATHQAELVKLQARKNEIMNK